MQLIQQLIQQHSFSHPKTEDDDARAARAGNTSSATFTAAPAASIGSSVGAARVQRGAAVASTAEATVRSDVQLALTASASASIVDCRSGDVERPADSASAAD